MPLAYLHSHKRAMQLLFRVSNRHPIREERWTYQTMVRQWFAKSTAGNSYTTPLPDHKDRGR